MKVEERFLKYVSFDTQSEEESETTPSTEKQKVLGKYLAEELESIGLKDARMDEKGYVYAYLPASEGVDAAPMGLVAHMDTAPAVSGANIKPRVVHYEGGDIELGNGIVSTPKNLPSLNNYVGQDLIVTDGTTLLGSDDKAGVAEIFSAVEYLVAHPEVKHGKICVGITPDEEIGRGADFFDIAGFGAEYAYTVDGGTLGELEYENFNAASLHVTVNGLSTHTGDAKNKMINAARIATEFVSNLPIEETPERTEGYEGFYHLDGIKGDVTCTKMALIIRDHDKEKFEARKKFIEDLTNKMNETYGEGCIESVMKDSYYNMKEKILPHMEVVDKAKKAFADAGVEVKVMAIRGGTDGARLSYEGLPCPNLSTGGENFHGIHEYISIQSMEKMVEVLVNICKAE